MTTTNATHSTVWSVLELQDLYERFGGTVTVDIAPGPGYALTTTRDGVLFTAETEWDPTWAADRQRLALPVMRAIGTRTPAVTA